jgi:hypothetical protein
MVVVGPFKDLVGGELRSFLSHRCISVPKKVSPWIPGTFDPRLQPPAIPMAEGARGPSPEGVVMGMAGIDRG